MGWHKKVIAAAMMASSLGVLSVVATLAVSASTASPALAEASFTTLAVTQVDQPMLSNDGTMVLFVGRDPDNNLGPIVWDETGLTYVVKDFEEGTYWSTVAFSQDGRTIVGDNFAFPNARQAFVWSAGTLTYLDDLATTVEEGSPSSVATGVNDDGTVVIGYSVSSTGLLHAVKWVGGTVTDLGVVNGKDTSAIMVSGDGSTVLLNSTNGEDFAIATTGGTIALEGFKSAGKRAFSADGSVLVGTSTSSHAVRIVNGSVQDLGVPDGMDYSGSDFVSSDGRVVVGSLYKASGDGKLHVFRWENGTMVDIGTLGEGNHIWANDVSADGRVIVGMAYTDAANTNSTAYYWDTANGLRPVDKMLTEAGLDLEGWTLTSAQGVSDDGGTLMGFGGDGETKGLWWARCVTPDSCVLIDDDILSRSLASLGSMGETGNLYFDDTIAANLGNLPQGGSGASVYAYGQFDSDPSASGGLGFGFSPGTDLSLGVGLSVGKVDTPLAYDGSARFTATNLTVTAEGGATSGLYWQGGITIGSLSGTVERGYLNGNALVTSSGDTTATGWGGYALLGWRIADIAPATSFSPYLSFSAARTAYEGWTETTGPMPATLSSFLITTSVFRAGASFSHDWGNGASSRLGLAYAHRNSSGDDIVGVIPSVTGMAISGDTGASDWVEINLGSRVPLSDSVTANLGLTTRIPSAGEVSLAGFAGLSVAF